MKKTFAILGVIFAIILIIIGTACVIFIPRSDPLAGWKKYDTSTGYPVDKLITADCQAYINTLPKEERELAKDGQLFCDDGKGQHAIEISIPLNGTWWKHVIIYDKTNKRVKVIKYRSGYYSS